MPEVAKVPKAGWPRCNEVHSPENRTGQAWKEIEVKVFDNEKDYAINVSIGHFACNCGSVVRYDEHGNAVCERCGEIYNSGRREEPVKIKSKITTRSFIYKAFDKVG
jgi:hypothetical protein